MKWRLSIALVSIALALCPLAGRLSGTVDAFSSFLPLAPLLAGLALVPLRKRPPRPVAAIAMLALVLAGTIIVPEWSAGTAAPSQRGPTRLIIVTHNVAVANVAPEKTMRMLASSDADILLLQETDGTFARYLPALAKRFPYRNSCRNRCSLAILSRLPLEAVRYRFRDPSGAQIGPGLLRTRVALPDGTSAPLVTLHLPWPMPPGPQARIRSALAETLGVEDRRAMILAGDFNLTPWSAAMRRLDQRLLPMQRATRALATYPSRYAGNSFPTPLFPIDHLFAGPEWSLVSVRRLARTGSDHYPVRVELVRNSAADRGRPHFEDHLRESGR